MIEKIAADVYKIEIPLSNNLLKSVNSYLIKGSEQSLLVDTGMNQIECLKAMHVALQRLSIDLNKTDLFITHLHPDHIGLTSKLATSTSKIYFNKKESFLAKKADFWKHAYPAVRISGFNNNTFGHVKKMLPEDRFGQISNTDFSILSEGITITIGDYCLTCIETPGHSPGHLCLYDKTKKILISGDHLLGDITPNISGLGFFLNGEDNPLKDYLESLEKTFRLEVSLVLPGHRLPFHNHRKRIQELKKHHEVRTSEIISILEDKDGFTAYEIAAKMTWELKDQWADFPAAQKWFAVSEAFSHLLYLEKKGEIRKKIIEGVWHYYL